MIAISSKPSEWFINLDNAPNSSIDKLDNGQVIIKSVKKEAAYIYMPIVVSSGETIVVNVESFTKSGTSVIYTNEVGFSSTEYNKLTMSNRNLNNIRLSHTAKLYNKDQILYVKIGSDSSMDTELTINNINIERIGGNVGTLRNMAFGMIVIENGIPKVHDRYIHSNIKSVSVDSEKLSVSLDINYPVSSSNFHTNMIPLINVSDLNSYINIYPKLIDYDQYTNKVMIRFINLKTGEFINPSTSGVIRISINVLIN